MWWSKKSKQYGWVANSTTITPNQSQSQQQSLICGASATVSYAYIMSDYQIKVSQRKDKLNKIFKKENEE